jgi:molecular chaperone GrpE
MEEDVIIEEEGSEEPKAVIKKLREKLAKAEAERTEYLDGWQRAKADFVNARREEAKEREGFLKFMKEAVLMDFVPLADHFERAFSHKEAWEKVDKNWRIGVESIYSELMQILEGNGLKRIGKIGEKFDPRIHEAVGSSGTEGENSEETVAEVENGYEMCGKVLRPAKVKINK